jgi:hypothetical protein
MKTLVLSFLLSLSAHATTAIDMSNTTVALDKARFRVVTEGAGAAALFDGLKVNATQSWEDTLGLDKSAAGVYCHRQGEGRGAYNSCEIDVNRADGVTDAVAKGSADLALAYTGDAAKAIYENLAVKETQQDAEGFTFEKTAPGLYCRAIQRSDYQCIVDVDAAKGVLR